MIIFLLILILIVLMAIGTIIHNKEMVSHVTVLQSNPPEKLVLFDEHGFEAAVKEERRQMAFDKFCLHYSEALDVFCSKPAGHDSLQTVTWDDEDSKPRHGYAGLFWST